MNEIQTLWYLKNRERELKRMKYIFFLIPLFLISLIPLSYAEIERGFNYDDQLLQINQDGSQLRKWESKPDRILIDGVFKDFHYTNFNDFMQIETQQGSVKLNKLTCSFDFYNKGFISGSPLFSDSIIPKMANDGTENWNIVTQINDASCEAYYDEANVSLVAKKYVENIGLVEYKYIFKDGQWKTQLEVTNLSTFEDKKFGFTQTINLNRDTIFWANTTKNLDNFDQQTFNRNFLENNESKVMNLLNDFYYDLDLAFPMLKSVYVEDNGQDKSKISFNFFHNAQILMPNETLIIDPTYDQTGTVAQVTDTGCDDTVDADVNPFWTGVNGPGTNCYSVQPYWNITTIPDSITAISSVILRVDTASTVGAQTCTIRSMEFDTSGRTDQQNYDDMNNGDVYVAANTSFCQGGAQTDVLVDLGATARANILAEIQGADNEFGIGIDYDSTAAGNNVQYTGAAAFDLVVIYTTTSPPWAVTDLTSTAIGTTTATLDWSEPYLGGGNQVLIGYQVNVTTPQTSNPTVYTNDTGTTASTINLAGLTIGTSYSARVSAWTNVTGDHPLNNATGNVYNFTTAMPTISCCAPTNLQASSTSVTTIQLDWIASTLQNLRGYKIERETPTGSGWTTLIGNTSSTAVTYTDTPLTSNIIYNYRVYGLNGTGQSIVSNTDEMTTYHKPDAVTDLTATANSFTQVLLEWTAPISYAPSIWDYQLNYSTPYGNPQTIIIHSPNVTASPYTVLNLVIGDGYSFRISPLTVHGGNASGNTANATTTTIFELGNLDEPDVTNTNDFQIFYTETITNSTSILLDVTYPGNYTLSCNMLHKFSGDNNTYTGLTETATTNYGDDTGTVKSSFILNGANTEIITVNCYDNSVPDSAKYIVTIRQFELLNQITHFRDGTYGTTGQFGGIDLITLIIVIIGMIGFNRVTPIAGVLFTIITVGVAAHFEIIEYYQIMFPALALIVLLAYTRTRQQD